MERRSTGLGGAVRIDLVRLHETWMELVFPRQLNPSRVLGKWTPETPVQKIGYYGWATLGAPLVALVYPLLLVGFATRFHADRLDSAGARLGLAGVVGISLVVWGALTVLARVQFSTAGFLAVLAASAVATVAAALALVFSRTDGRLVSVLLAYPSATTAIFLPPVVAALYSPTVASLVFTGSESIAIWILDNVLTVGGLNTLIRESFDLRGVAYVGMWFALAVPLGWVLGGLVALANLIRPTEGGGSRRQF